MYSDLSAITDIIPESDRYAHKALWAWYDMHAPGAGTKCCCGPEVRYLGPGSE